MYFAEFCSHFMNKSGEQIAEDVKASVSAFMEVLGDCEAYVTQGSFAERMIAKAREKAESVSEIRAESGQKGGKKSGETRRKNASNTRNATARPVVQKVAFGSFNNVMLTEEQHREALANIPKADVLIEKMSSYLAQSGKTYKNYYAALVNWSKRDEELRLTPAPARNSSKSFAQQDEDRRSKSLWQNNASELLELGIEPPTELITHD